MTLQGGFSRFFAGWLHGFFVNLLMFYWVVEAWAFTANFPLIYAWLLFLAVITLLGIEWGIFWSLAAIQIQKAWYLFPFFYLAFEYFCFPVFPLELGNSLVGSRYAIQAADLFGVHGLSFLTAWSGILLYQVSVNPVKIKKTGSVLVSLYLLLMVYGVTRFYTVNLAGSDSIRVTVVQPNTPVREKKDKPRKSLKYFFASLREAIDFGPSDLIVYPESIFVPSVLNSEDPRLIAILSMLPEGCALALGCNTLDKDGNHYNTVGIISQTKGISWQVYRKRHLLVMGEYIPFSKTFPSLRGILGSSNHFRPGKNENILKAGSFRLQPSICFENLFPGEVAGFSRRHPEVDVLLNISEDGWFGKTAAPYYHYHATRIRSIELRKPMIRCANTGISAMINERGEEISMNSENKRIKHSKIFEKAVLRGKIYRTENFSLYMRVGDVLPWLSGMISLIFWVYYLLPYVWKKRPTK